MIKSTELMIGDWVLVSGTPRRVESITKKKIGFHFNPQTDNRLHYARLHDVEPIEITESFLRGNGFSDLGISALSHSGSYTEDIKYLTIIDKDTLVLTSGLYIEKGNGESEYVGKMSTLRAIYIHHLQQMYRMWGIQKEWKL